MACIPCLGVAAAILPGRPLTHIRLSATVRVSCQQNRGRSTDCLPGRRCAAGATGGTRRRYL